MVRINQNIKLLEIPFWFCFGACHIEQKCSTCIGFSVEECALNEEILKKNPKIVSVYSKRIIVLVTLYSVWLTLVFTQPHLVSTVTKMKDQVDSSSQLNQTWAKQQNFGKASVWPRHNLASNTDQRKQTNCIEHREYLQVEQSQYNQTVNRQPDKNDGVENGRKKEKKVCCVWWW